jgi:SMI1 / KNR4 family (SUKH-1)
MHNKFRRLAAGCKSQRWTGPFQYREQRDKPLATHVAVWLKSARRIGIGRMAVTFSYRTDVGLSRRQVSESDLAAAECELGVRLPDDFRAFLLRHDGPAPSPAWFPVITEKGMVWVGPIMNILSTARPAVKRLGLRSCCLETLTLGSREMEGLPADYVVMAQTASQPSTLLLSVATSDYGTIYAWRVRGIRFRLDQLIRVAVSFTEWLGMLREPPAQVAANFRDAAFAQQRGLDRRPAPDEYDGPEALAWLQRNRNPAPLAANHFGPQRPPAGSWKNCTLRARRAFSSRRPTFDRKTISAPMRMPWLSSSRTTALHATQSAGGVNASWKSRRPLMPRILIRSFSGGIESSQACPDRRCSSPRPGTDQLVERASYGNRGAQTFDAP